MELETRSDKVIDIHMTPKNPRITVKIGGSHSGIDYPVYHGQTYISPEAYDMQILETENTVVKENIIVLPIPYYQTTNPQGGNTIYIGD